MKLIIDIDEKKYEEIKQIAKAQFELTDKTEAQIIANGIPVSTDITQGEWRVNNYGEHICPVCGHYALYDEDQDNDYYEVQSNFCPNCGSKMKGGAE